MEALAAFGLAVNILTVIDLSVKILNTSSEIRNTGDAITRKDRAAVAADLESCCGKIETFNVQDDGKIGSAPTAHVGARESSNLFGLAKETRAIAKDIQEGLRKRQLKSTGFSSLRHAVMLVWGEPKMRAKMQRLKDMRDEIQFSVIVSMRGQVDVLALNQSTTLHGLDLHTRKVVCAILTRSDNLSAEMDRNTAVLSTKLDQILNAVQRYASLPATVQETNRQEEMIMEIRQGLWFHHVSETDYSIEKAYRNTFGWIFETYENRRRSSRSFVDWLRSNGGIYWITGKAGSGKSTLMKYIIDETRELYQHWAGERELLTARYWFQDQSTNPLQKSLHGLYQSVLYQIVKQKPSLTALLFPYEEERLRGQDFLSFDGLRNAFNRLIELVDQDFGNICIALYIDALDECNTSRGGKFDMAEMLRQLAYSENFKILVSSRPESAFRVTFKHCDKLRLHEWTFNDHKEYVKGKLKPHDRWCHLTRDIDGQRAASRLISSTAEKAEGIFLWSRLVVQALRDELYLCNHIADLQPILDQFPRGLEQLFTHKLGRVPPEERLRGAEILTLMRKVVKLPRLAVPLVSTSAMGFTEARLFPEVKPTAVCIHGAQSSTQDIIGGEAIPTQPDELEKIVEETHQRLSTWCAGLVELHRSPSAMDHSTHEKKDPYVVFIHRSVVEFLDTAWARSNLNILQTDDSFNIDAALIKGFVTRIKATISLNEFEMNDKVRSAPHKAAKRLVEFDTNQRLRSDVEIIMKFATHAEHPGSPEITILLDEMDYTMAEYDANCTGAAGTSLHWSMSERFVWSEQYFPRLQPYSYYSQDRRERNFLFFAIEYGLTDYAVSKLELFHQTITTTAHRASLLVSACRPSPSLTVVAGTMRPKIIKSLLDLGADPNCVCSTGSEGPSSTAWLEILRLLSEIRILSHEGARQLSEILIALLEGGADPMARLALSGQEYTAKQLIDRAFATGTTFDGTSSSKKDFIPFEDFNLSGYTVGTRSYQRRDLYDLYDLKAMGLKVTETLEQKTIERLQAQQKSTRRPSGQYSRLPRPSRKSV